MLHSRLNLAIAVFVSLFTAMSSAHAESLSILCYEPNVSAPALLARVQLTPNTGTKVVSFNGGIGSINDLTVSLNASGKKQGSKMYFDNLTLSTFSSSLNSGALVEHTVFYSPFEYKTSIRFQQDNSGAPELICNIIPHKK